MATTDIINYMKPGADVDSMNRRKVESFISTEAIAANDVVSLDGSQSIDADVALYISKADSGTATDSIPVGIALDSASGAGEIVRVVVRGIAEANVDGATVAGNSLAISATAGRLGVYVNTDTTRIVAVALEADTANVATVYVYPGY
ncbi:MAG: hypothetical protein ACXACE_17055 [Candidatus Thorarchaeota archaeon]|jgi:hypothetical protein